MRDDERAQMMLLAAFLLVIGFVAMGAMVARVNQLPTETVREQDIPILLEVDALDRSLDGMVWDLNTTHGDGTQEFQDNLTAALNHVHAVVRGHGFSYRYDLFCATPADPTTAHVDSTLTDGVTEVRVRTGPFELKTCP